jgi:ferritin-like metal-binding protein YciE
MAVKSLDDLFHETLKDIYYVEKKLVRSIPKLAKHASSPELKDALESHLRETEMHVDRLEQVFNIIDRRPSAKKCEAYEGLAKEADEVIEEIDDPEVCDAAIAASAQTIEHYEMSRYGTLATWAKELNMQDAAELLETTLQEEKAADQKLSALAEQHVNHRAAA